MREQHDYIMTHEQGIVSQLHTNDAMADGIAKNSYYCDNMVIEWESVSVPPSSLSSCSSRLPGVRGLNFW